MVEVSRHFLNEDHLLNILGRGGALGSKLASFCEGNRDSPGLPGYIDLWDISQDGGIFWVPLYPAFCLHFQRSELPHCPQLLCFSLHSELVANYMKWIPFR